MWTHLQPHLRSELTSTSITKNARVSLYRAMNLRRLIAMAGSGATATFGMPDWKDVSVMFKEATQQQINAVLNGKFHQYQRNAMLHFDHDAITRDIQPLLRQLNTLCGNTDDRLSDADESKWTIVAPRCRVRQLNDHTIIMDICEAILERLPVSTSRSAQQCHIYQ